MSSAVEKMTAAELLEGEEKKMYIYLIGLLIDFSLFSWVMADAKVTVGDSPHNCPVNFTS